MGLPGAHGRGAGAAAREEAHRAPAPGHLAPLGPGEGPALPKHKGTGHVMRCRVDGIPPTTNACPHPKAQNLRVQPYLEKWSLQM